MKSEYSNYIMKMAKIKNIVNEESEFVGQSLDMYFSTNKVRIQLNVVPFYLLKFVYNLKKNNTARIQW